LAAFAVAATRAVLFIGGFASYLQVAACRVDFPMGNSTAQPALGYINGDAVPLMDSSSFRLLQNQKR